MMPLRPQFLATGDDRSPLSECILRQSNSSDLQGIPPRLEVAKSVTISRADLRLPPGEFSLITVIYHHNRSLLFTISRALPLKIKEEQHAEGSMKCSKSNNQSINAKLLDILSVFIMLASNNEDPSIDTWIRFANEVCILLLVHSAEL
jgi:hypothetical protein